MMIPRALGVTVGMTIAGMMTTGCSAGGANAALGSSFVRSPSVERARTAAATASPAPSATSEAGGVYVGSPSGGIDIYSPARKLLASYASNEQTPAEFTLDDAGDTFVNCSTYNRSNYSSVGQICRYKRGATSRDGLLNFGTDPGPYELYGNAAGTVVVAISNEEGGAAYEVWDPGVTGKPSRTLSLSDGQYQPVAVGSDGTIAVQRDACGTSPNTYPCIAVFPKGAMTPSRLTRVNSHWYVESLAVASDDSVYVAEFNQRVAAGDDKYAGVYRFSSDGAMTAITEGAAAPVWLDLAPSGDLLVVNNNSYFTDRSGYSTDTAHTISVYAPSATTPSRTISAGISAPYTVVSSGSGTLYVTESGPTIVQIGRSATAGSVFLSYPAGDEIGTVATYDGQTASL
jgi:hypothetical protein